MGLQEKVAKLEHEIKKLSTEAATNKMSRAKAATEELIDIFDTESMDIYQKTTSLQAQYDAESKKLSELKEKVSVLVAEREAVEKIEAEERAKAEAEQKRLDDAATKIQATYRGHRIRH